jgi:hypothetical protein
MDERIHAIAYDRARERIVARISVGRSEGARMAVRAVVREWYGIEAPTPLYREPWLWVGTVGAAAAAAVTVFLLTRPPEKQHDVVFGFR